MLNPIDVIKDGIIQTCNATNHSGDVATILSAQVDGEPVIVKVAANPACNMLIANEREVLGRLTEGNVYDPLTVPSLEDIERIKYAAYVPKIVPGKFSAKENGDNLEAIAIKELMGFYPLSQVVADIGKLDAKDVAWIWRRLLVALGFVHNQGYVHAAVYPEHIMIQPEDHGVVLIDWCYARPIDSPAHAYISRYHDVLPKEFLRKHGLAPATDVKMATEAMVSVIDPATLPPVLRGFSQACMNFSDAWRAKESFDNMIERAWGPRKFRPMNYPTI